MLAANRHAVLAVSALFACLAAGAYAQQGGAALALAYDAQTRGPVPIPPSERNLQTVVAEPFTDFRGIPTDPQGGAYYVSRDFKTITPVLPHLAMANGIALSPTGKELWITEFSRNLLHRVELAGPTNIAPFGTAIAYQFTGLAPDSMRADSDGNLYVAMYGQGRVLVFNKKASP